MRQKRRRDLLLAAGLLLLAGGLWLFLRPGGGGAWAVVTVGGRETARFALDGDRTVTLGDGDYNILQISGGAAAVVGANCGDQTCVRMGPISREGESIVCLPHRLAVRIEGGGAAAFDAAGGAG